MQCFSCKELGHFRRDCIKEKGKQRASKEEIGDGTLRKKSRDEHSSDSEFLLLTSLSYSRRRLFWVMMLDMLGRELGPLPSN